MRTSLALAFAALLVAVAGCAPADVAIGLPCDADTLCPSGYTCSNVRCGSFTGAALIECMENPPQPSGTCGVYCDGLTAGECDGLARGAGEASCSPLGLCQVECNRDGDCPSPLHCSSTTGFGDCVR